MCMFICKKMDLADLSCIVDTFCHPYIALDLAVHVKLWWDIRAWIQIWVYDHLGSLGPRSTKWADDQHSLAELKPRLVSDLPHP